MPRTSHAKGYVPHTTHTSHFRLLTKRLPIRRFEMDRVAWQASGIDLANESPSFSLSDGGAYD